MSPALTQAVQVALLVEPVLAVALDSAADGSELVRRLGGLAGEHGPRRAPGTPAWPATLTARAMLSLVGRAVELARPTEEKALLRLLLHLHVEHWARLVAFYAPGTPERWRIRWPLGS